MAVTVLAGDCRDTLKTLDAKSVQCAVTSPPYFGLRDYGSDGQIGLEETPDAYVAALVGTFREVWRVLRDDGTLWLNIGDTYAANRTYQVVDSKHVDVGNGSGMRVPHGMKPKDLMGIPWMVAFALRADGWYLRSDVIWHKPNAMPESVLDRPTRSHEHIFLFSKNERYYYDAAAIAEPASIWSGAAGTFKRNDSKRIVAIPGQAHGTHRPDRNDTEQSGTRNKRDVWSVNTQAFPDAHYAVFPPSLIEPCILAGSRVGGVVLDPFGGSGTTGMVATKHRRDAVLCELNPDYAALISKRLNGVQQTLPWELAV